jgi:hypothetical protein
VPSSTYSSGVYQPDDTASAEIIERILQSDVSLMDHAHTQMSAGDRQSFLTVLAAFHSQATPFAYLEVGSYRGGSLQPYLVDPLCQKIFSIDKRPVSVKDERGHFRFDPVTTDDMLKELWPHFGHALSKLVCIDSDTANIQAEQIDIPPSICFIDGEHTDEAVFRDFLFCLKVGTKQPVLLFHDTQIIFRGVRKCVNHLSEKGVPFFLYLLPDKMAAIEVGQLGLVLNQKLLMQVVASPRSSFEAFERLAYYRDWYGSKTGRLARTLSGISQRIRLRR